MKKYLPFPTILISFLFLIIISCSKDDTPTEPTNNAPKIQSVSASPSTVKVNETTSLTCVATDEDGDDLTYTWSSEEGTFPNGASGSSVSWKAPSEEDTYKVSLVVSDGKKTDQDEKSIVVEKADSPSLAITPQNLDFSTDQTQLKFSITNGGTGTINYSVSDNKSWITISSTSGSVTSETDEITVTVNRSSLSPGDYSGTITVSSNAGNIDINVTMTIPSNPALAVSPQNLEFGSDKNSLKFNISNSGTGSISYTISDNKSWIGVSSTNGSVSTETDEITVTVNRTNLSAGDYSGTVTVSSNAGNIEIAVTMTVPSNPTLAISPQSLEFGSDKNSLQFNISNSGTGSINYTISDNKSWISISSGNGNVSTETDEITVTVSRTSLSAGDYDGKVIVNSNVGDFEIDVTLTVLSQLGNIEGFVYQINTSITISGVLVEAGGKSYTTGSNGYYKIEDISAGSITAKATKSDYEVYQQTLTIETNGMLQHDIYLTGSILSTNISGNIWDNDTNEPISGVKITIAGQIDYTDATGHYQLMNIPQGTFMINAEKEEYQTFEGEVFLSSNNKIFNIELEYLYSQISGTINDSHSGMPLENVAVRMVGNNIYPWIYTDRNGFFEYSRLTKGSYTFTAFLLPYPQHFEDIQINTNTFILDVDLLDACEGTNEIYYGSKKYNTVRIREQCWFKENLNIGEMITSENTALDNEIVEKYCYDDNESNCDKYGGLYRWHEAMQYYTQENIQGICPNGWHIPSLNDFGELKVNTETVIFFDADGNALKEIGEGSGDGAGTNLTGFSALLGGGLYRGTGGAIYYYYAYLYESSRFWSSTLGSGIYDEKVYTLGLLSDNNNIYFGQLYSFYGSFSVRCIKD